MNNNKFILKILLGFIVGLIAAILYNVLGMEGTILGDVLSLLKIVGLLFVGALKAIAPLLVFVLIISAISKHKDSSGKSMFQIVVLYLIATFCAALIAVLMSWVFPTQLTLDVPAASGAAPSNVFGVLGNVLKNVIDNPINALATANYLGVLFWAILIGVGLRRAKDSTKNAISEISDAVSYVVKIIISFAPYGIMGIVFSSITENGLKALLSYGHLIFVLLASMAIMIFVVNAVIVYIYTKEEPFSLILKCLKFSGLPAFFTRSSAANIPINLELCKEMNVKEEIYSVSIPLGSTINMTGAAITITTLTLAAAYTTGVDVTFTMALLLSLLATVSACGASGVAGGSLLLIPLAASLFGIPDEVAMQVVAIGFVIGIIQDSCETALNSSSDALYTIIVDRKMKRLEGKKIVN